jgi:hypothetical protein
LGKGLLIIISNSLIALTKKGEVMSKPITLSFVATKELKQLLEQWAAEDDRTVSATLRQILEREARRRKQIQQKQQVINQQSH